MFIQQQILHATPATSASVAFALSSARIRSSSSSRSSGGTVDNRALTLRRRSTKGSGVRKELLACFQATLQIVRQIGPDCLLIVQVVEDGRVGLFQRDRMKAFGDLFRRLRAMYVFVKNAFNADATSFDSECRLALESRSSLRVAWLLACICLRMANSPHIRRGHKLVFGTRYSVFGWKAGGRRFIPFTSCL